MDKLDRRILDELQRDASRTMVSLAERVGSTPATCHRRFQRLKQAGYISSIVALVDPGVCEAACTAIIGVTLRDQRHDAQRKFREFIGSRVEIRMAWMTTGEFDYVLVAAFPDHNEYACFLDEGLQAIPVVERYRSFLSVDELKFSPGRPVLSERIGPSGSGER